MKRARETILNTALKLFARKGYAGSTIREICQAAGVTKPVLYYHFRCKEHLYQELMMDIFNQTRKNLLRLSQFRGSLRERLILYVSSELRNCRKDPDNIRLLFRMMFSPEGEYPYFNFIEEFKRERKIIAGFIRESRKSERKSDPELVSTALMGLMLMVILEYLFTGRRTLTRSNAERLVDLLLPSSGALDRTLPLGIATDGGRS
jgi:TetR/AcrR family transcriptional regulator